MISAAGVPRAFARMSAVESFFPEGFSLAVSLADGGVCALAGVAPVFALAAARMSAVDDFFAMLGTLADAGATVALFCLAAGGFFSFESTGFGSGFGTIEREDGSMSYQAVLLN